MKNLELTTVFEYSQFKYKKTANSNEYEILPYKDIYGKLVILEDKIATINASRFDSEKNAKLLTKSPELLSDLNDLVWLIQNGATIEEIQERALTSEQLIKSTLND